MSENKIHTRRSYNLADNIRHFVREWAEAIRNNPGKITVETFTVKNDDTTRYTQTFAPAGLQAPYAFANSVEWMEPEPKPIFYARIVSTLEGDGGRVTVPPVNDDEHDLLTEAFKYWHPLTVEKREEAERTFKREAEAVRQAQLPAFDP